MPRIVRGALLQASWTGDKESMIQKHEAAAHDAAKQGSQVMLFQELFYGPYFCQVQDAQYYAYTELIPDGPTTKRMQDLAKQTGMVLVVPMYEEDAQASGIYYNTAAVIDADGKYLGKYRKTHIPHVKGFWEKFYFRPGNMGYPVFETAVGKVGVYICYDRHFPEGARALGLNGAEMVFIPSATSRGLSEYLWRVEQVSHAVANGYFVGTINRVGIEKEIGDDDFYGQSYFCDPRGPVHRRGRVTVRRGADRAGHGPRRHHPGPPDVAVLPRSTPGRVRRPHPTVGLDRRQRARARRHPHPRSRRRDGHARSGLDLAPPDLHGRHGRPMGVRRGDRHARRGCARRRPAGGSCSTAARWICCAGRSNTTRPWRPPARACSSRPGSVSRRSGSRTWAAPARPRIESREAVPADPAQTARCWLVARRRPSCGTVAELDDGSGPRDVLRGVDLKIRRGERVALMGRNGAARPPSSGPRPGRLEAARGRASALVPGPPACSARRAPATSSFGEWVGDESTR